MAERLFEGGRSLLRLDNLLSNALKFTFEGRIAVRLSASDERAVLQVSDTGTGIPAEELPRVFERFHRVPGSRSCTHEGSGIGLALVSEIVAMHGGTVEAESVIGEGTTFTVRIPLGSAREELFDLAVLGLEQLDRVHG